MKTNKECVKTESERVGVKTDSESAQRKTVSVCS